MARWYAGNTGRIIAKFKNAAGALTDATAVSIRILKKLDGTETVASTSILANKPTGTTGEYYYDWAPAEEGIYVAEITATVEGSQERAVISFEIHAVMDAPVTAT